MSIKTKKGRRVNERALIATVDVSKVMNTGYYRCPDGRDVKPFLFSNSGEGFKKFWERIAQAKERYGLEEIVVGIESTGSYGEPLLHYLKKRGATLVQVNPMHTKKLKELEDNSPQKSDEKDPKVIADIIEYGHALTVVIPEGAAAELRRLSQARERNMVRRIALLNQLQGLVGIIFPEFLEVMKGVNSVSSRYLLKKYPRPEDILGAGLPGLTAVLKKMSRGKLKAERAEALYEAAQTSIGIKEGQGSIVMEIGEAISLIETHERFTDSLEKKMSEYLGQIPSSRFILSMKGIGIVTTAGIIGEIGDFSKFRTIAEIMKLAGLNLCEVSSGRHTGQRHISKRGRSFLRKLLYFAALNTVRKGGVMHEIYQQHVEKGMPKGKAIIAIARKILGIIYALVRNESLYLSDYVKAQDRMKEAA